MSRYDVAVVVSHNVKVETTEVLPLKQIHHGTGKLYDALER